MLYDVLINVHIHVDARDDLHTKKKLLDSWFFFDQTFLGLGLGKLFPARESLVSDIPAGDGNTAQPFFYRVHSPLHISDMLL